jgi:hypothetical protein
MVCEAPQPPEKVTNRNIVVIKVALRPITSLSLDQMIIKPTRWVSMLRIPRQLRCLPVYVTRYPVTIQLVSLKRWRLSAIVIRDVPTIDTSMFTRNVASMILTKSVEVKLD